MKPTKTFLAPAGFLTAFLLFSLAVPGARAQVNIDQIKLGTGNGHSLTLKSGDGAPEKVKQQGAGTCRKANSRRFSAAIL